MSGFLDGGVFIGRDARTGIGFETVTDLIARLDTFSIDQALAHDFSGTLYDFSRGNAHTATVCAQSGGRLIPVATININGWDPSADRIEDIARQFRVIALHARWQGWRWNSIAVERLAYHAKAAGVAVQPYIIAAEELADAARALCPSGASVLFRVLGRGGYNLIPEILAIAERWPNAYFDVGAVTQTGGIAYLVQRIGAGRLYVASGSPITLEGAPLFAFWTAELDDEQRALVAGGTLRQVLGLGGATHAVHPPASFERLSRAPKIDTHSHTGTWNVIEPSISHAAIRRELDRNNIQTLVVNSIQALNGDIEGGNASLAEFVRSDSRLFGLIVVDPTRPQRSFEEIDRYRTNPKFVGLKTIQDFYEKDMMPLRLDHADYRALIARAAAEKLPIMAHIPGMPDAARAHPDAVFICAHATWRYKAFAGLDNVYYDIATSTSLRSECDLRGLIDTVGVDRVIYSSDSQLMTTAFTFGKLASISITDGELEKILLRNALSAFPRLRHARAVAA